MDIPTDKILRESSLSPAALHKLVQWLSPSFPVGAYAYSHGLEWAVHTGDVHDGPSARGWIFDILSHGSGRNEGILLAHAYQAKGQNELQEVAELAQAFVAGAERLQETNEMGTALAKTISVLSGTQIMPAPYPVVLGRAARVHSVPLAPTLSLYLHSFGANLVSSAQRLVPLGQIEGQEIIANLSEIIENTTPQILHASLEDLGGCAIRADMASMSHENQQTRLFRT